MCILFFHVLTTSHGSAKVYHPNIDLQGNVCLNILREEWKPILSISAVVYGLQFLFLVSLKLSLVIFPHDLGVMTWLVLVEIFRLVIC